jgi:hypothetical protein
MALQTKRQQAMCTSRDLEAKLLEAQDGVQEKVRKVAAGRNLEMGGGSGDDGR